jgi:hypothetical protein
MGRANVWHIIGFLRDYLVWIAVLRGAKPWHPHIPGRHYLDGQNAGWEPGIPWRLLDWHAIRCGRLERRYPDIS